MADRRRTLVLAICSEFDYPSSHYTNTMQIVLRGDLYVNSKKKNLRRAAEIASDAIGLTRRNRTRRTEIQQVT